MSTLTKQQEPAVINGLNTTALGGLIGMVEENPQGGRVTFLSKTHWQDGARSFTRFGGYKVEGDKAVTRWTFSGTHKGQFQNMPPTGKQVVMSGITIFRITNSKIIEGWNNPDLLGLLQQLGAVPALEQS